MLIGYMRDSMISLAVHSRGDAVCEARCLALSQSDGAAYRPGGLTNLLAEAPPDYRLRQ